MVFRRCFYNGRWRVVYFERLGPAGSWATGAASRQSLVV
jgi:hypothetical protein